MSDPQKPFAASQGNQDEAEKPSSPASDRISRRVFLGSGAAAAAAALVGSRFAKGDNGSTYNFYNSFGNVVPVSPELIQMGLYPPQYPPTSGAEPALSPSYESPNIMLIMVDQLRTPRWVPPSGGAAALAALIPNITSLKNESFSFPNFFAAATACTPSRSTLLTGLYTQQTCLFQTIGGACQPVLQTGFENIATVLAQSGLDYSSWWIGKWHLSDAAPNTTGMGANGPTDYGFTGGALLSENLNFPPNSHFASPSTGGNLGNEGYNNFGHPLNQSAPGGLSQYPDQLYDDAAICNLVVNACSVVNSGAYDPWFMAASFVNPHDITQFPFSYNLSNTTGFGALPSTSAPGYPSYIYPPPVNAGTVNGSSNPDINFSCGLPGLNTLYNSSNWPTNWNYDDYPTAYNSGYGKPDLQTAYQNYIFGAYGEINNSVTSWTTFLNYYFWMQTCVDVQIGRVLQAITGLTNQPLIIFLSDHGEYGGSHGLHAKGGALYDEAINVPLYVSYPSMRANNNSGTIPFVCSMVDVLPFLYATGLGNEDWRRDSSDVVSYLNNRESIFDAIFQYSNGGTLAEQRRVSNIMNNSGANAANGEKFQPYILHTTDEFPTAIVSGNYVQSHAVAFRTVDLSDRYTDADGFNVYGGGKLGIYSYWPPVPGNPTLSNINAALTQPQSGNYHQFEFYDYSMSATHNRNYPEVGNEWLTNPRNSIYLDAFTDPRVQSELYLNVALYPGLQSNYMNALLSYAESQALTGPFSSCPAPDNDITDD
jgi:arylsulfatase A-like enzyme